MPSRRAITCPGIDDLNLFFLHPSFASLTHSSQVKGANYDARPDTRQAGFCGPGIQKKPLVKRRDPKISQASFIHRFDLLRRLFDSVDGRNPAPLGMEKKLTANKLPINWCRISEPSPVSAHPWGWGVFHNPCTTRYNPITISPTNKIHYPTTVLVQSHTNSIFRKYPPPLLPSFFKVFGSANLSGVQSFFYVFFRI